MVYLAANDETKQQLHNILGGTANEGEIRQHFARMLAVIDSRTNENYTLNIANRFYVQQGFFTRESFARALRFYYGETLHKFDYERNNQLAQVLSVLKSKIETKRERWWSQENNNNAILLQEINNWVSDKTRSKITELITADDVNKDIVILLLNAIYFGGIWKTQFDDTVTRNEAFHISECETKNVNIPSNVII
uniref:Antithrombin-III n=1 Tax=Loa loa TaxID=7209 RepID=A0A1I7VAY0_LOALO